MVNLNGLEIQNVQQIHEKPKIRIYFEINENWFQLYLSENSYTNKYVPEFLLHYLIAGGVPCPFCGKKGKLIENHYVKCVLSNSFLNDLFKRLITFRAIRLEWIYLDYEDKV